MVPWIDYNEGMINHDLSTNERHTMSTKNKVTAVEDDAITEVTKAPAEITFSAKDLAAECETDPKSFRRWLRSYTTSRANKGGRWIFTAAAKAEILKAYAERGSKGTEPTLPDAD
jgi:hypothetical protein